MFLRRFFLEQYAPDLAVINLFKISNQFKKKQEIIF